MIVRLVKIETDRTEREKMARDRQYHYDVVTNLENELRKARSDGQGESEQGTDD